MLVKPEKGRSGWQSLSQGYSSVMAKLLLIRINHKTGEETVLETSYVPDSLVGGTIFYPSGYFEELEKHFAKTGKPRRRKGIDAIYICRPQVERWDIELLEKYAPSLEVARLELKKRLADVPA